MRFLLCLLALLAAGPSGARAQKFTFIALGDMPYTDTTKTDLCLRDANACYDRLIDQINAAQPAFSIHVGDTKSGSSPCTNAAIERAKAHFDRFAGAVIYSIGDNEWTDCHRTGFKPNDLLAFVRSLHFQQPQSLGQRPLPLKRQADEMAAHKTFVENAIWRFNGVLFVSLHIPGSNNNRPSDKFPGDAAEFAARDEANQAWIAAAFAAAASEPTRGIVLAFQGNPWDRDVPADPALSGYTRTLANIATRAAAFARPVLLIMGDTHEYTVDQPLKDGQGNTVPNVTRLMVMGERAVHAVRVTVDPDLPGLFSCEAFMVAANPTGPGSALHGDRTCAGQPRN